MNAISDAAWAELVRLRGLMAMVEPLPYTRDSAGSPQLLRDAAALARAATVASALGTSSAFTWLKLPACEEPDVVFGATTLPCVVLGGAPGPDVVRGLVVGRSLLHPPDGDAAGAVDAAAKVLRAAAEEAPSP